MWDDPNTHRTLLREDEGARWLTFGDQPAFLGRHTNQPAADPLMGVDVSMPAVLALAADAEGVAVGDTGVIDGRTYRIARRRQAGVWVILHLEDVT